MKLTGGEYPDSTSKKQQKQQHFQVLEIEVHNQNIRHRCGATTNNNASDSADSSTTTTKTTSSEQYSSSTLQADSIAATEERIGQFEEIVLSSDQESTETLRTNNEVNVINYNTLTLSRHRRVNAESDCDDEDADEGTYEKRYQFREDRKSVVSYDSIYLSSEGSDENTIVGADDGLEDPLPEIRVSSDGEFIHDNQVTVTVVTTGEACDKTKPNSVDSLYSQIKKSKPPKVLSLEPKTNLTSFSDTSTRGTLERLTFISSSAQQKEGKLFANEHQAAAVDNQYCSLPDASIGISLRASERIDAKLRLSCSNSNGHSSKASTVDIQEGEESVICDSISRFGKAHKRLRQRENCAIVVLNPISIEQQPKVEEAHEILPTTICLGKKQVIVDELAAKAIKCTKDEQQAKRVATKNISKTLLRGPTIKCVPEIIVTDIDNNIVEQSEERQPTIEKEKPAPKVEHKKPFPTSTYVSRNFTKIQTEIKAPEKLSNATASVASPKQVKPPPPAVLQPSSQKPTLPIKSSENIFKRKDQENQLTKKFTPAKPKRSLTDLTPESFKLRKVNLAPLAPIERNKIELPKLKPIPIPPPPPPPPSIPTAASETTPKSSVKPKAINSPSQSEALRNEFKANLTDTLKKRIAHSRSLFSSGEASSVHHHHPTTYNARPIRISSVDNIAKLNDTYEIHPSLAYKVKYKDQRVGAGKMSRPQILNVIDTKRNNNVCSVAPRQSVVCDEQDKAAGIRANAEAQNEFQEKVDAVRCYWSKLIDQKDGVDEVDKSSVGADKSSTDCVRNFVTSLEQQQQHHQVRNNCNERKSFVRDQDDVMAPPVTSFCPMVEIIELDGNKQAAVVNAQNIEDQDFDHVRYKVMKSDTFQKNIMAQSRKEAQFDGLLQYLHNYSFQVSNQNKCVMGWGNKTIKKQFTKKGQHSSSRYL